MGESSAPDVTRGRRIWRFGLRFVLLPIVLLLAVEGISSIVLLVHDIRGIKPLENFRQAAYDSLVGWVGIPNLAMHDNYGPNLTLTTNAEGMRIHRPVTPALAPGERRIICSGDSFTFGSGVADNETFCAYLEQEFSNVRTLNMAQRGYGIDQAYLWYKRDAVKYPHQVHVFAFISNDFERMALKSFWGYPKPILRMRNGQLVTENLPVPVWKGWSRWPQGVGLLSRTRMMQLVQRHVDLSDATKMRRVEQQVWNVAEGVFTDLARLNKERGSDLVLVYLPSQSDLEPGPYDVRRTMLAEFSQKSGIPVIDLTSEMRTVSADSLGWMFITPNALPVDGSSGHYTAAGHRWVAARIAEHLRAMPATATALALKAAQ